MIRVCGQPVRDGDRVVGYVDEPVLVEGSWLKSVRSSGHDWRRERNQWTPPGRVRHRIESTSGETAITIVDREGRRLRITLERVPVKLDAAQIRRLRDDLGQLALSFQDESVVAEVVLSGATGRGGRRSERAWLALFAVLARHLPPLLESPLRVQRLAVGPVRLERAGISPRTLLARATRDGRGSVLAQRREEGRSTIDYGWIAQTLRGLQAFARRQVRGWARIAFDGHDAGRARWQAVEQQVGRWLGHPVLGGLGARVVPKPTWTLTRHPHGAPIVRASGALEVTASHRIGRHDPATRRLMRAPIADDAHLYELWVVLRVVEILRLNFGFGFIDGEPQRFHDYGQYDESNQRWALASMRLVRRCESLDGRAIEVEATVHHEPELLVRGAAPRTPDLVLDIEANGWKTRHGLDAKYIKGDPLVAAHRVARRRYLEGTALHTCFLAIPSPTADLGAVATRLDAQHQARRYPGWAQAQYEVPDDPRYGVAWGTVFAAPGDDALGLRQFVTLALQYHRTELRHICANCGTPATLDDVDGPSNDADLLDAHFDVVRADGRPSPALIEYHCAGCDYSWSRHRCLHGHVLMKHGKFTPHRQIDGDHNVACSACGHRVQR